MTDTAPVQQVTEEVIKDPKGVLEALARYREEAKSNREAKEALEAKLQSLEGLKAHSARQALALALKDAGVDKPDRLERFFDIDSFEMGDDYSFKGLREQVEKVMSDFPEVFDKRKRVGGQADAGKGSNSVPVVKSTSEIQAERLLSSVRAS